MPSSSDLSSPDSGSFNDQVESLRLVPQIQRTAAHGTPISPQTALRDYFDHLTLYERREITQYPHVYFVGRDVHKKMRGDGASDLNHGFDDERGDYRLVEHDHIAYRFEVLEIVGRGSFGQVAKVFDYQTRQYVALKLIRNKKRFQKQALVEVKVLDHIRRTDSEDRCNLIRMIDHFQFRNHLCISFEMLSLNLYDVIKNNSFRGFAIPTVRKFATQILQALVFLRQENIIHCDLKPENLLLKQQDGHSIKVIDFGSSCFENEKRKSFCLRFNVN